MIFKKSSLAIAVAAITTLSVQTSIADDKANSQLEEVIVTSQKRDTSMQDIAIAGSVVSGQELKSRGVQRMDDLTRVSPALTINDTGLAQHVNIRGIGLSITSPSTSNGVATYYDGLFQPAIVTRNSFYDIASVEVLRGPQGTFVGSNSTAGAIFINSVDPSLDEVKGYGEFILGNYNERGFEGAVNLPLSDTLAFRGAVLSNDRDAFFKDIGPLKNTPTQNDEFSARASFLWQPTENLEILSKTEKTKKDLGGFAYKPFRGSPNIAFAPDDVYTLDYNSRTAREEDALQSSLRIDYSFADGYTFRSQSGYQKKDVFNSYDRDGTGETGAEAGITQELQEQFIEEIIKTQEFNIISPDNGPLSWIAGAYYQKNEIEVVIPSYRNDALRTQVTVLTDKLTTGVFGQVAYRISDELSVDVGIRNSSYKAEDLPGSNVLLAFIPRTLDIALKHQDPDTVTGKLNVSWTPNASTMFYAFVAKGYKSGGPDDGKIFKPETVMDYELGYKGSFMDDALKAQLSYFYYDYEDFQYEVEDPITNTSGVTNTTGAIIKGFEGQLQGNFEQWYVDLGFSYVDSSFDDYIFYDYRTANLEGMDPIDFPVNVGGESTLYAPELTMNASVEYRHYTEGGMLVAPRLTYSYNDEQWAYMSHNPELDLIPSQKLLSAQVGFEFSDYKFEIYGKNLTNQTFLTGQTEDRQFYNSPRQIGIRAGMNF